MAMEAARAATPPMHAACAAGWQGVDDLRAAQHLLLAGLPLDASRVLLAVARSCLRRDPRETVAAVRACERALAQAAVAEGDPAWGEVGVLLTRALAEVGDWAQAGPESERLLRSARAFGWTATLPPALVLRGEVERGLGDPAQAKLHLEEALTLCMARRDDQGLARAARGLGRVALLVGRFDEAGRWFQQAQAMFTRLGNVEGAGACLLHRADLARFAGNGALAAELLLQAQRALERTPNVIGAALVALLDAELTMLATPSVDGALRARAGFSDALHVLETVGASALVSRAAFGLGMSGAGAAYFTHALRAAQGAQDFAAVAVARCGLVWVHAEASAAAPEATPGLVAGIADAKAALSRAAGVHPEAYRALERAVVSFPHPALLELIAVQRTAMVAAKLTAKTNLPES
jgi:tetratricopeptide (TPR) repeat protein